MDNEEALKKIKNQLTEIKISTSKLPSNANQKSSLINASSNCDDLSEFASNKPIIADNSSKFNKNKPVKNKGSICLIVLLFKTRLKLI